MGIILKRICMENYKLFDSRTVEFSDALTVFGGPNGYGKTSTFEAIELLITGDISRVNNNEAISAKLAYGEQFLAKNQSRDVVIKGEFVSTDGEAPLVIIRCIPHIKKRSGTRKKDLNPRSLKGTVKTYFATDFDLPQEQWEPAGEKEAEEKLAYFFGAKNIARYTLLHYVRQEDRLAFFKQKEEERTQVIEGLFGLTEYREKLKQAESRKLKWTKLLKPLGNDIEKLRTKVNSLKETAEQAEYIPIAQGKPVWDREELNFRGADSSRLYQELLKQVDGVEALIRHREEFAVDADTGTYRQIPEGRRALAILAWKICRERGDAVEFLRQRKELEKFCRSQSGYLQKSQYHAVNWAKVCQVLDVPELAAQFADLAARIKSSRENQTELEKSLTELDDTRNLMHRQMQGAEHLESGTCPYCGQNWGDMARLDEQFQKTGERLRLVLGREAENGELLAKQCEDIFRQQCEAKWEALRADIEQDAALQIFSRYPNWQSFRNDAQACAATMDRLSIVPELIPLTGTADDAVGSVSEILERAEQLCNGFSAEYVALDQQYGFRLLFAEVFGSLDGLTRISLELVEKKRQYIRYQYYLSFDASREALRRLEEKRESLKNLLKQMDLYIKSLKKAINAYSGQLIGQIEIPFFLYSSRLLQSYHGGQGVLISTENEDGADGTDPKKVRFTAPGREHDVLYTMSSGQLSAVLLAFTLSLNQIYAGNGFRTMLIDDPIQCMDDINMVSLVELLGREFGDAQVILSTHEDTFAKYIRYKYDRYGLTHKAISLKDSGRIPQNA